MKVSNNVYLPNKGVIIAVFAVATIVLTTGASGLMESANAARVSKVDICHCNNQECRTLHLPSEAANSHLSHHEDDYSGQCTEPTPSASPTPIPSISPSPSSSPTPELTNCSNYVNDSTPVVVDDVNSYSDGSIIGQGGWESYVNGNNFSIQGAVVNEGSKALHNNLFGDSVIGKQGTSQTDGKQAVCFRTENRTDWGFYSADGNAGIRVSKGLNASGAPGLSFASVSLKQDGNVAYYDQIADVYQDFATYSDNEWTLLEIEWRSSDKAARYRINSGTWTDWKPIANSASFTGFDYVNFGFVLTSGSGGVYFDTLR